MSKTLVISLVVFSVLWIIVILNLVRNSKISIKYSMVWIFMSLIILLVGIFPKFMSFVADKVGFLTVSNLVTAILLTLLLIITLVLTMIVTNQRTLITKLIQEISLLKGNKK